MLEFPCFWTRQQITTQFENPFDNCPIFESEKQGNSSSYFHQFTADYNSFVNRSAILKIISNIHIFGSSYTYYEKKTQPQGKTA